jgi:hypothetical protein
MNNLKIKKDKILTVEFDEATDKFIEKNIADLTNYPLTKYFSQVVEMDEDVTVGDFLAHLKKHSEIIDLVFYSYMNGESIVQYCDLALQEPKEKYFIDEVELFWATELFEDEYCLFGTFHGVIKSEEKVNYIEENNGLNSFPLDIIPVSEWQHCRLVINESIKASSYDENDDSYILKLKNRWTFFELIEYFLYELMCYGSVDNQAKEIEKYKESKNKYEGFRVDPEFAEKLDKEELILFVGEIETQIEIADEALEIAVENDDFESAKELKEEKEELQIELDKMKQKLSKL